MASRDFLSQHCAPTGSPVALDYSLTGIDSAFVATMEPAMQAAFLAMESLESGAIANPDEDRMVGHYWLRDFARIPDESLRKDVIAEDVRLRGLVKNIHSGGLHPPAADHFENLLVIGIGGSALGPQLVADALGKDSGDRLTPYFLDNTDPEGIARVFGRLKGELQKTLAVVVSKSGGTPETRNGMLLAEQAWRAEGLNLAKHAIAITGRGSKLDQYAERQGWIARLAMYDWVGGRTSVMSAVGLLPAALQGIDIDQFLMGAREMDEVTRSRVTVENPAALLALFWHRATNGRGEKDMVVLPYKDRLLLFSRYLQQLVMESLGKQLDLSGKRVEQGISVYGNKGSTDQHAYVQQLRDGVNNFFAVFVEVLADGDAENFEIEPGVTAGDYLSGFYQGTRRALAENGRSSATLTIESVTPETLGALIALFERAVGLYATLVNINAYHQPGVEAGKKAAAEVLAAQAKLIDAINSDAAVRSAEEWGTVAGVDSETAYIVLRHLAFNGRGVAIYGRTPSTARFSRAV